MGWSAWALDNLWLVAGGSLLVSFLLHFAVTWLFKNSGKTKVDSTKEDNTKADKTKADSTADKTLD